MLQIVNLVLGVVLLIWGRKLFSLFIAAAGFMTGLQIASQFIRGPLWIALVLGIIFAIIGALLALFLKNVAIGVAGFLMGGYLLALLGGMLGMTHGLAYWGFFLVGGVGGAILMSVFFDLALIWLSSLAGTTLVMGEIHFQGITRILIFVAVLFIGALIQTAQWRTDED